MKGSKFNIAAHLGSGLNDDAPRRTTLKVVPLSIHDLVPSADNFYSLSGIEDLKRSIEIFGVKQNLTVKPIDGGKYEIVAGHRRHKACKELVDEGKHEFEYVPCGIETGKDELKERILLIMTNSTTRTLSDFEKLKQAEELRVYCEALKKRDGLPGRVRDMVAEIMNESATQIARYSAISNNLVDEFQEEMQAGRLGVSVATELAQLPQDAQRQAFQEYTEKGGMSIRDAKALKDEAAPPAGAPPAAKIEDVLAETNTGPVFYGEYEEGEDEAEIDLASLDFADMTAEQRGEAAIELLEGKRFDLFPPGTDTRLFDFIIDIIEHHILR